MELLSKDMLKSISFDSLNFIEPFSEISQYTNQYKGQIVFLKDCTGKPGVLISQYVNAIGVTHHKFSSVGKCLNSSACSVYNLLLDRSATNIKFAIILAKDKICSRALRIIKNDYLKTPLDNHFNLLKPWLDKKASTPIPINNLNFRRPFIRIEGFEPRSSFSDYVNRGGIYVVQEKRLDEGTVENVYVGKSFAVLPFRIKDKFYPNEHLYYKEIPGIKEYYISVIEIQKSMLPDGLSRNKAIKKYEDTLIEILQPRDNKKGKIVEKIESGYKPIYTGKGEPFPAYT